VPFEGVGSADARGGSNLDAALAGTFEIAVCPFFRTAALFVAVPNHERRFAAIRVHSGAPATSFEGRRMQPAQQRAQPPLIVFHWIGRYASLGSLRGTATMRLIHCHRHSLPQCPRSPATTGVCPGSHSATDLAPVSRTVQQLAARPARAVSCAGLFIPSPGDRPPGSDTGAGEIPS
jgi:hypothetical protein